MRFKRHHAPAPELTAPEKLQGFVEAAREGRIRTYEELNAAMAHYTVQRALSTRVIETCGPDDTPAKYGLGGFSRAGTWVIGRETLQAYHRRISGAGSSVELTMHRGHWQPQSLGSLHLYPVSDRGIGIVDWATDEDGRIISPHDVSPSKRYLFTTYQSLLTRVRETYGDATWDPDDPQCEAALIGSYTAVASKLIDRFLEVTKEAADLSVS